MDEKHISPSKGKSLEKAFEYIERSKSRTFIESLGTIEFKVPEELAQGYPALVVKEREYLSNIRTIQAQQYQIEDALLFTQHEPLHQYREKLDDIYKEMESISPKVAEYVSLRQGKPLSFDGIKECLTGNIVLVEYYTTPKKTFIFIIKNDFKEPVIHEIAVDQKGMFKLIETNFGHQNKFESLDIDLWQEQCECFVEPLTEYLNKDEIIYFIPHGLLHYLPLHALKVKGQYLIEKYPVLYSPSASVIKYCQKKRRHRKNTCLVFGDSLGKSDVTRKLIFAGNEAEKIAQLFGSKAYLQNQATLQTFRKEARDKDIIHLACHGEFKKNHPLESNIQLSDGYLTARDIFTMKFNANLVVLSACASGINEYRPGDELIGLTRAFIYAGTSSIIVSLWKIDDEATGFLIKSFYNHLLGRDGRKKVSKVEALQKAQKETMTENTEWEHPYYWSSFVLVGDWL